MRRSALTATLYCSLVLGVFHAAPVIADGEVAALMELVRNDPPTGFTSSKSLKTLDGVEPEQIFADLIPYKNDPSQQVRHQALSIASHVSKQSKELSIRQQGVEYLVDALTTDERNSWAIVHFMTDRPAEDYSPATKEKLHHVLMLKGKGVTSSPHVFSSLIRIAGKIDLHSAAGTLRDIVANAHPALQKDAKMALARMGDEESIRSMVEYFESNANPQSSVSDYFGELEYMRQPEAVEILVHYLFSDEVPPKPSIDLSSTSYAAHAYRCLLFSVDGFYHRFEGEGKGPLDSRILTARQWIKEQGVENLEIIR